MGGNKQIEREKMFVFEVRIIYDKPQHSRGRMRILGGKFHPLTVLE